MKKIIKTAHVAVVISSILTISVQAQTDREKNKKPKQLQFLIKYKPLPENCNSLMGCP